MAGPAALTSVRRGDGDSRPATAYRDRMAPSASSKRYASAVGLAVLLGLAAGRAPAAVRGGDVGGRDVRLAPSQLGGVTRILRYAVAQPDRSETALLLLAEPTTRGGAPEQVQVVGVGGEQLQLSDTQGADCTLERVWIRLAGEGGPEVVYARRTFGGDLKADVQSDPAAMEVSVFRPRPGAEPGDSAVVLRLAGPPRRTRPVCAAADVAREMKRLSAQGGAKR